MTECRPSSPFCLVAFAWRRIFLGLRRDLFAGLENFVDRGRHLLHAGKLFLDAGGLLAGRRQRLIGQRRQLQRCLLGVTGQRREAGGHLIHGRGKRADLVLRRKLDAAGQITISDALRLHDERRKRPHDALMNEQDQEPRKRVRAPRSR